MHCVDSEYENEGRKIEYVYTEWEGGGGWKSPVKEFSAAYSDTSELPRQVTVLMRV